MSALRKTAALPLRSLSMASVITVARVWRDRRQARIAIAQLDAHLLRDIGISQHMASNEAAKLFWQK